MQAQMKASVGPLAATLPYQLLGNVLHDGLGQCLVILQDLKQLTLSKFCVGSQCQLLQLYINKLDAMMDSCSSAGAIGMPVITQKSVRVSIASSI